MADNNNDNSNSVAKVMEISVRSTSSFDDAIQAGIARASKTLRGVTSAWVKEQRVEVQDGRIVGYQANLLITFTLED
jgi:flavin-binding protein dodecin